MNLSYNQKFEIETTNEKAIEVIAALNEAIKKTGLPIRSDIKRVPKPMSAKGCRIIIKGDWFNFAGFKAVKEAVKNARVL